MATGEMWVPSDSLEPPKTKILEMSPGDLTSGQLEDLSKILEAGAIRIPKDDKVTQLMPTAANAVAGTLDVDYKKGISLFRKGVTIYSGLLASTLSIETIPCDESVFENVVEMSDLELAEEVVCRLQGEAPVVCDLISELGPVLGVTTREERNSVLGGAGFVHLLIIETLDNAVQRAKETEIMESMHPDLATLGSVFDAIMADFPEL